MSGFLNGSSFCFSFALCALRIGNLRLSASSAASFTLPAADWRAEPPTPYHPLARYFGRRIAQCWHRIFRLRTEPPIYFKGFSDRSTKKKTPLCFFFTPPSPPMRLQPRPFLSGGSCALPRCRMHKLNFCRSASRLKVVSFAA